MTCADVYVPVIIFRSVKVAEFMTIFSFDLPCILIAICLFVTLVILHFGFGGRYLVLNVPFPDHYLSFTF